MKTITIATLKGGAGKTMTLFNLAGVLAESNKVLLIDVDPQCNLSNNCGIDSSNLNQPTIYDIFKKYNPSTQPTAESIIVKHPIEELPNLDIIPSSLNLFFIEEEMINLEGRTKILSQFFKRNEKVLKEYNYILMDTNPSMSIFNLNAFYAADSIILTTDVSFNGVKGVEMFCALWDAKRDQINATSDFKKEDNIDALIISNFDKRPNLSKDLVEYLNSMEFADGLVCSTKVPATVKLKNTELAHKPINVLLPSGDADMAIRNLVNDLKDKGVI